MADVLIRGMEMQKGCRSCPFYAYDGDMDYYCLISSDNEPCPLVPLPEGHGRLGDLDALDRAFTSLRFNADGHLAHWDDRRNWCLHGYEIERLIGEAPIIVPAEGGGEDG